MENQSSVLIIDDDYDLASLLQTILRNKGYKTLVAHSAAQVASLLAQTNEHTSWPVSLILLDLMMPQVDGNELYGWLRAHPKTADTPIIVLSAVDSIAKRVELLNRGADDYIVKPCPVEELLARISIHIKLHDIRQARQAAEVRSSMQANFLNAIDTVSQQIQHPGIDLQETLAKTAQAVVQYFDCVNCAIYVQEKLTDRLNVSGRFPADFTPPSSYLPFLKRITLQREGINSSLTMGVPLIHNDNLLGIMVIQVREIHQVQGEIKQGLTIIARQVALAIANANMLSTSTSLLSVPSQVDDGNLSRYEPLQTVYSYLQLLTEFEMDREKQVSYLRQATQELGKLLDEV